MQPPPPAGPPGPLAASPVTPPAPPTRSGSRLVGLLLVLPAVLACLCGYAWPTVRTFWRSLQARSILGGSGAEWVGLDNYERLGSDPSYPGGYWFALSLGLGPLLVLLLVGLLLAWLAHGGGRGARLAARLALVVPMVFLAPVAVAIAYRLGPLFLPDRGRQVLAEPTLAPWALRVVVLVALFGVALGLGVTLYLAALRATPGSRATPAVLAAGGIAALATLAVALQAFSIPQVLTGGGPVGATRTPMLTMIEVMAIRSDLGHASAQAVLLLLPLMALGILATLIVIFAQARIELAAPDRPDRDRTPGPSLARGFLVATILAAIVVLGITLVALAPWLARLTGFGSVDASQALGAVLRSWLPPLVPAVIGVGVAALAGFGIGALRPLGRWSELLLLPFAPWLFVFVGPLAVAKFETAMELGQVNTLPGLLPPVWLVVPALVLFTVLFRGLAGQQLGYGRMVALGLPMLGLVGGATWLVQSQALLWPWLMGRTADRWNATMLVTAQLNQFAADPDRIGLGLVLPVPMILLFAVALAVLQVFYLDRLALRVGRSAASRSSS